MPSPVSILVANPVRGRVAAVLRIWSGQGHHKISAADLITSHRKAKRTPPRVLAIAVLALHAGCARPVLHRASSNPRSLACDLCDGPLSLLCVTEGPGHVTASRGGRRCSTPFIFPSLRADSTSAGHWRARRGPQSWSCETPDRRTISVSIASAACRLSERSRATRARSSEIAQAQRLEGEERRRSASSADRVAPSVQARSAESPSGPSFLHRSRASAFFFFTHTLRPYLSPLSSSRCLPCVRARVVVRPENCVPES